MSYAGIFNEPCFKLMTGFTPLPSITLELEVEPLLVRYRTLAIPLSERTQLFLNKKRYI